MIEKRKYARLNIDANVKYKIIGQRQKDAEFAKCDNMSPEGLCLIFQNAANLKIGTKLDIEITIKDCKPFHLTGEIIWLEDINDNVQGDTGKVRVGVKISEIAEDDENRFLLHLCDRMVQRLNKDYLPPKS
ncbi:MAG: PilZ domain-containing protein [Candidatus Omnitrophica bacterium]|nr:PilZ domain-containing protein [Candidatus Omnitrophota bacterium]